MQIYFLKIPFFPPHLTDWNAFFFYSQNNIQIIDFSPKKKNDMNKQESVVWLDSIATTTIRRKKKQQQQSNEVLRSNIHTKFFLLLFYIFLQYLFATILCIKKKCERVLGKERERKTSVKYYSKWKLSTN